MMAHIHEAAAKETFSLPTNGRFWEAPLQSSSTQFHRPCLPVTHLIGCHAAAAAAADYDDGGVTCQ